MTFEDRRELVLDNEYYDSIIYNNSNSNSKNNKNYYNIEYRNIIINENENKDMLDLYYILNMFNKMKINDD
jgi:hypothetical protein